MFVADLQQPKTVNNPTQQQVNGKQIVMYQNQIKILVFHNKKGQSIDSPSNNMDKSPIY